MQVGGVIDPDKNLVFDGFTFANGRDLLPSSSAITIADASPQFLNCIFKNNSAMNNGGVVLIYGEDAKTSFIDCVFTNNTSDRSEPVNTTP